MKHLKSNNTDAIEPDGVDKVKIGISYLRQCPECKCNWSNGEIPEDKRHLYAPPYFFSKLIGIEDPYKYDGISWWACPECYTTWDRWTEKKLEKKWNPKTFVIE